MNCLYCYKKLAPDESDYHKPCSRKLFAKAVPPQLPYNESDMLDLGKLVIKSQAAVTGVQPKLSLEIQPAHTPDRHLRFTIVGLWGSYILKPPTSTFPHLPETEDLTMHLASLAGLATVPHALIRMQDKGLAYITKRIDRLKDKKLHMEDMCQLTERLTEDKYKGSYEQIAKAILKYSANPGLDYINFYEQVIFSFLTGNADMHLKNFSLIDQPGLGYTLAPAYDMVASALLMKEDEEELALTLNGKKNKIQRRDFDLAMAAKNTIDKKSIESIYKKFTKAIPVWLSFIPSSFLPTEMQEEYKQLIMARGKRLEMI